VQQTWATEAVGCHIGGTQHVEYIANGNTGCAVEIVSSLGEVFSEAVGLKESAIEHMLRGQTERCNDKSIVVATVSHNLAPRERRLGGRVNGDKLLLPGVRECAVPWSVSSWHRHGFQFGAWPDEVRNARMNGMQSRVSG
jgi:hypothetical protein